MQLCGLIARATRTGDPSAATGAVRDRPSERRIDCPFGHNRSLRGVSHVNRPSRRQPLQVRCGRRTSKACPYTFRFPLSTFNSLLPPRSPIAYCLTLYCLLTFHFPLSTSRCLSRTSKACPYTFRFQLSTRSSPRPPIAYCLIPYCLNTFHFPLSTFNCRLSNPISELSLNPLYRRRFLR